MLDFGNGYQAYKNTSVDARAAGADIHKLVLMLFDGFMDELSRVEGHIQARRFDRKAESIDKLVKILGGLEASLDQDNGGEVAANMQRLYQFCGNALLQASLQNDLNQLTLVREIMTNLQQGWQGLAERIS